MASLQQTPRGTVLVVDDEAGMRIALTDVLERGGWQVEAFDAAEPALNRLESAPGSFALIMTDFRMSGMTGLELTRRARFAFPEIPIVMMTAFGTVEDAVTAMKEGADDYLLKPFSMETVLAVVENATQGSARRLPQESAPTPAKANRGGGESRMVGRDAAWMNVVQIADEIADSNATVLLMGDSGTGKEILARHIHERSGRVGPFVAINCAALPEGVLESELFGHEKGAFTGAILARKGRFELAQGGTILLDEVSEIPLGLQAKLLRVLQEREVSPVGGANSVKLDIRIIATTNRDLEEYAADGHFRQDLFYRLNVIAIRLPQLRERPEDILLLAEHFLRRFRRAGRPGVRFSPEAAAFLRRHAWPGNVRELENLVERASLLARGEEIQMADFHMSGAEGISLHDSRLGASFSRGRNFDAGVAGQTLEEVERRMILQTLDQTGGNRTRAAELLGVSVRTIRNKLHQYGIAVAGSEA